jgi:hypothetical protein
MESRRINAEELKQVMAADFERLAQEVAEAMNAARDGNVIADTEELVRNANAVFRQQMYAKAIGLLQSKQEAFSPSAHRAAEQRAPADYSSDRQRTSVRA